MYKKVASQSLMIDVKQLKESKNDLLGVNSLSDTEEGDSSCSEDEKFKEVLWEEIN